MREKMEKKNTKKTATSLALYGILVALAFIFSYIEALIPIPIGPVPGMKLGLANMIVLVSLYTIGIKSAFTISIIRILLVSFTFGNLNSMLYSLAGGIVSFLLMILLKKTERFSMIGVSIVGGVSHNIGQMLVATAMLGRALGYYYPFLCIVGAITGAVIGVVAELVTKRVKKYIQYRE